LRGAQRPKQSSFLVPAKKVGLLRFARNDGKRESTMSKLAFDKIKAALEEVKAYLEGSRDKSGYRIHTPKEKK
jgi:hypothetical protein